LKTTTNDALAPPRLTLRKLALTGFIILNLFTLVLVHTPVWVTVRLDSWAARALSPMTAWRLGYAAWYIRRYAYAVGLDNRWEMFSYVYRTERRFVIQAQYKDGTADLLPLPLQGNRTLWQAVFADFREFKFHLNLYRDRAALDAYLSWLVRTFSNYKDRVVDAITIEIEERPFHPTPQEAAEHGTHYSGPIRRAPFARVACSARRDPHP
jgi:hypothetical protein